MGLGRLCFSRDSYEEVEEPTDEVASDYRDDGEEHGDEEVLRPRNVDAEEGEDEVLSGYVNDETDCGARDRFED